VAPLRGVLNGRQRGFGRWPGRAVAVSAAVNPPSTASDCSLKRVLTRKKRWA